MKISFLFLFFFTLFFFVQCSVEESELPALNSNVMKTEESKSYIRMDISKNFEYLTMDALSNASVDQIGYRSGQNMSTNGHFSPIEDWECTFSGMKNNSGVHGAATITGPPVGFHMTTECLTFDGSEAVYGGIITEVFYQDEFFLFLEPGVYCAFKVRDNGEGQNAPPDQVATYIWFWFGDSPCQYLPPSSEDWGPMLEVLGQGDQIQVK